MNVAEKVLQLKQDFDDVYEAGKSAGVGDNPLDYAKSLTFESMNVFGKANVVLDLGKVTLLERLFYVTTSENKNTTVENLTINHNGQPISMSEMIYQQIKHGYASGVFPFTRKHFTLRTSHFRP